MNDDASLQHGAAVTAGAWERIDGLCDAFEAAWHAGRSLRIEEFEAGRRS